MKAMHLRTDYLDRPLGLGNPKPEFSWYCDKEGRINTESAAVQTAYRLIVLRGNETIWDTGKVASAAMTHIAYSGAELQSRDQLTWRVQLWDETDGPGEWAESTFEIGLLKPEDWKATWITGDYAPKHSMRYPVDCFCKRFSAGKKVLQARLYVTACGLYTARLNGEPVGDGALLPGCTDYNKRLHYQTFDVTKLLQTHNTLEFQLADGWYRGSIGCFGNVEVFGNETKLLCQLEMEYADGTRQIIGSDASFKWSSDGPLRFADLKDGEEYDAARMPGYGGHAKITTHKLIPTASDLPMPKCRERFAGRRLTTPQGKTVFDFGQNLAGFLCFDVQGHAGQKIHIRLGETLDENGEFTQFNFQKHRPDRKAGKLEEFQLMCGKPEKIKGELKPTPRQEVLFTCSGRQDHYQTQFSLFGFRYALVETEGELPENFHIESIAVYTDLEQTGEFRCSNDKINRLYQNVLWSMKSNYLDVPTDCPTRERLAWTGDAQLFLETGAYLMNVAPFFRKWLRDLQDAQGKDGKISAVVPLNGMDMMYVGTGTSAGWGESCILIPCRLWKRYGDVGILRENYPMMQKYAAFLIKHTGHKKRSLAKADPLNRYVYEKGTQLGEWMEPDEFRDVITATSSIPQTEVCTAYLSYTMRHMEMAARALGDEKGAAVYAEYAGGARKAYREMFLADGIPDTDRQAKLVRPLAFGLAAEQDEAALQARLARAVENRRYRIGTGFLSTPFILGELTRAGRSDLAYKMLENEQAPGWLYEVNQGATTIWEGWEGYAAHDPDKGSLNHYSPGSCVQWMFESILGIHVTGERYFTIRPVPGGSLTAAEGSYESVYGTLRSAWKRENNVIRYTFEIPANTQAQVLLPGGTSYVLGAGVHQMTENHAAGGEHELCGEFRA